MLAPSRRRTRLLAWLMLVFPVALAAQTGTITGKVTDRASRLPIPEARIVVPGTTLETQTNAAGEYRLNNVRPGRTNVGVFKLGHRAASDTVRVVAGQTTTLDFSLAASLVTLSELVVTGTVGNQERRAQPATVATLDASALTKTAPVTNVGELLQSRVPGVSVSANSGTAGAARQIRIRGASSINLSNQPLLFVDGVRVNEGILSSGQSGQSFDRMNDISPDDIESIEVVKGPAAATLYGADASAGVIQIITKKGRPGANNFAQTLRLETATIDQHFTPPDNYGLCTAALVAATSRNPLCRGQAVGTLVRDNPLERVGAFRTGSDRQIGWDGRGGGQNYGYNLSFGTERTQGTLPNNGYERYNVRSNFNYIPDSRVTIEAGVGLTQSKAALPDNDNNVFGWLGGGLLGSPTTRVDTSGIGDRNGFYSQRQYNAIAATDHSLLTHRVISNLTGSYLPVPWFTNRITLGMDYASDEQRNFFPKNDSTWYGGQTDGGSNDQISRGAERYTVDYLGNVRRTLGAANQWETNLSFGSQMISTRNKFTQALGVGFVTNENNSVSSAATTTGRSGFTEQRTVGYLSQLQVGYENRAFVQVGVRVDKNSSFGNNAPAFVLPKVGATWTVSEETFYAPLAAVLPTLRLRAAYGTTGRSPNPGDALQTLISAAYAITPGASASPGAILGNPGNDSLRPERGKEFEAGADFGFLHDRVSGEVTYFRKVTNDLIIARPIAPSNGFNTNPLANIGAVLNSGVELGVSVAALRMPNLDWDLHVGANTLRNELTDLGGLPSINLNGQLNRAVLGEQLGVFSTKKILSINDATGVVVVSDTLLPVGNVMPTFEWNLSNTFTVRRSLRLSALLDAKRNFSVFNNTQFFRETQLVRSNKRLDPSVLSRHEFLRHYGNDAVGKPAFVTASGAPATVNDVQEAFIQPGDFVRLREISATLDMPQSLVGRALKGSSVTVAMQNVKLWTRYEGADPEVISNQFGSQFSREDFLTLPNPRKVLLRLNLTF
ncbi:MAG: putative outer membrane protein [Gemmatimonadetes bacterium]|nr:putative outer membrane protein [Gemmatimonadota bacterium]